jgi:hypothetical protein
VHSSVDTGLADDLFARKTEEPLERGIHVGDSQAGHLHERDGERRAREHRREFSLARRELLDDEVTLPTAAFRFLPRVLFRFIQAGPFGGHRALGCQGGKPATFAGVEFPRRIAIAERSRLSPRDRRRPRTRGQL